MTVVRRIKHLPPNFGAFVDEVSEGMGQVYGRAAAEEYRKSGAARILATIAHPGVEGLAILQGQEARAILMSLVHEDVGQIFFLHVLRGQEPGHPERELLRHAVAGLRAEPIKGIVCETLVFNPLHACEVLEELDFRCFERGVMRGPLDAPELGMDLDVSRSRPFGTDDFRAVAECLVSAYASDPATDLHREVTTLDGALRFVEGITKGSFGEYRREFGRCIEEDGQIVSVLLGCEAACRVGFVVQVATRPEYRNRGHAEALMREAAAAFRLARFEHIALGVTLANPARRLYERLGLSVRCPVDAYVWWR